MPGWTTAPPWQVQDPGLGEGLAGELWALCQTAAPTDEHENHGWAQARLNNQGDSTHWRTCVLGVVINGTELGCSTYRYVQEPDRMQDGPD